MNNENIEIAYFSAVVVDDKKTRRAMEKELKKGMKHNHYWNPSQIVLSEVNDRGYCMYRSKGHSLDLVGLILGTIWPYFVDHTWDHAYAYETHDKWVIRLYLQKRVFCYRVLGLFQ